MTIRWAPTADQARELGNRFDMLAIPNPSWRWQRQYALIDGGPSPLALPRPGFIGVRVFVEGLARNNRQPRLECLLDLNGIILDERVFLSEHTVSPIRGLVG
jgi:hypothetical protein